MGRIKSSFKMAHSCTICGKEYESAEEAQKQRGSYATEEPRFTLGTLVRGREQFACLCAGGPYLPVGKIVKIVGPLVGNLTKPNGGRHFGQWGHVYLYEVDYACPHCFKKKDSVQFWTSELELAPPVPDWQAKASV
jgi:hypothetical protein